MGRIDRQKAIQAAETAVRAGQGGDGHRTVRRVVAAYPADWNSVKTLADLYLRTQQTDKAVPQLWRVADHFAAEGFHARAAALYRKVARLRPEGDRALVRAAEMSVRLGLLADARQTLSEVEARRRDRGDKAGVAAIRRRIDALDAEEEVVPPV